LEEEPAFRAFKMKRRKKIETTPPVNQFHPLRRAEESISGKSEKMRRKRPVCLKEEKRASEFLKYIDHN
jgi:hypothetical protein